MRYVFQKKLIFVLAIILFSEFLTRECFAQDTYFIFDLPSKILVSNRIYKIKFSYNITGADEKYFLVIPQSENTPVEIFNEEKNIWVKSTDLRSSFPSLSREMKIRITGSGADKSNICFLIQYTKGSENFKSSCRTFWSGNLLNGYINKLNDRIDKWRR